MSGRGQGAQRYIRAVTLSRDRVICPLSWLFPIATSADGVFDADKTFFVTLGEAVNVAIERSTAVCTIVNGDPPPKRRAAR